MYWSQSSIIFTNVLAADTAFYVEDASDLSDFWYKIMCPSYSMKYYIYFSVIFSNTNQPKLTRSSLKWRFKKKNEEMQLIYYNVESLVS